MLPKAIVSHLKEKRIAWVENASLASIEQLLNILRCIKI